MKNKETIYIYTLCFVVFLLVISLNYKNVYSSSDKFKANKDINPQTSSVELLFRACEPGRIIVDSEAVYLFEGYPGCRIIKYLKGTKAVIISPLGEMYPSRLFIDKKYIYYQSQDYVYRLSKDLKNREVYITDVDFYTWAIEGEYLYWLGRKGLYRTPKKQPKNRALLYKGNYEFFTISNDCLVVIKDNKMKSVTIGSNNFITIAENLRNPGRFRIFEDKVYWVESEKTISKIFQTSINKNEEKIIAEVPTYSCHYDLDNEYLYYSYLGHPGKEEAMSEGDIYKVYEGGAIYRIKHNGEDKTVLISELKYPVSVVVDGDYICWCERHSGLVKRVHK